MAEVEYNKESFMLADDRYVLLVLWQHCTVIIASQIICLTFTLTHERVSRLNKSVSLALMREPLCEQVGCIPICVHYYLLLLYQIVDDIGRCNQIRFFF